jgi:hypothetical protein
VVGVEGIDHLSAPKKGPPKRPLELLIADLVLNVLGAQDDLVGVPYFPRQPMVYVNRKPCLPNPTEEVNILACALVAVDTLTP